MSKFKKDVKVKRIGDYQTVTLDDYPVGCIVTIESEKQPSSDEVFDISPSDDYYAYTRDYIIVEEESDLTTPDSGSVSTDVPPSVVLLHAAVDDLKGSPKTKENLDKMKTTLKDLKALQEALAEVIPDLEQSIEETAQYLGEFTVEQLAALAKIATIKSLEGEYIRDGVSEPLFLNDRGSVRPPFDTHKPGDTLNIQAIGILLNNAKSANERLGYDLSCALLRAL